MSVLDSDLILGRGSFGLVLKSKYKDEDVALKIPFKSKYVKGIGSLKELDINHKLNKHEYIITLLKVTKGLPLDAEQNDNEILAKDQLYDHISLIYELAEKDGNDYRIELARKEKLEEDDMNRIIKYMCQLLVGLEYMHFKNIIHRDIRLDNFLIKEDMVKICDFGFSCFKEFHTKDLTCLCNSHYRAPELCVECSNYDEKIDIWSVGCCFFELITSDFLFTRAGSPKDNNNGLNTLKHIFKLYSLQDNTTVKRLTNNTGKKKSYKINWSKTSFPENLKKKLVEKIPDYKDMDPLVDIITQMLQLLPDQRFSATEALNHPIFNIHRESIDQSRKKYIVKTTSDLTISKSTNIDRITSFIKLIDFFSNEKKNLRLLVIDLISRINLDTLGIDFITLIKILINMIGKIYYMNYTSDLELPEDSNLMDIEFEIMQQLKYYVYYGEILKIPDDIDIPLDIATTFIGSVEQFLNWMSK